MSKKESEIDIKKVVKLLYSAFVISILCFIGFYLPLFVLDVKEFGQYILWLFTLFLCSVLFVWLIPEIIRSYSLITKEK